MPCNLAATPVKWRSVMTSTHLANGQRRKAPANAKPTANQTPAKFTYQLASYRAELRKDGWYVARSEPSFAGNKPEWIGPYQLIENAAYAIARRLMIEMADRHSKMVEFYRLKASDPLYGLKKPSAKD